MNPKAWKAEIKKLEEQIEPLRARIATLRSALHGPYVEPVFVLRHGDEENSWSYTLTEAFTALSNSDDDYGTYDDVQGVSVGGCLITQEQWSRDPRSPQGAWALFAQSLYKPKQEALEALLGNPGQAYLLLNGIRWTPDNGGDEKSAEKGAVATDLPASSVGWLLEHGEIRGICEGPRTDSDHCTCPWCRYSALAEVDIGWLKAHGWNPPERPKERW